MGPNHPSKPAYAGVLGRARKPQLGNVHSGTGAEPDGSREHPYTFINGMDVSNGKYYTFESTLYLAKADMKPCVWNPGTPGLWQWEVVG